MSLKVKPMTSKTEKVCEECVMPTARQQNLIQHADGAATLQCVTCPFCKKVVNAFMTKTSISCPECKAQVDY